VGVAWADESMLALVSAAASALATTPPTTRWEKGRLRLLVVIVSSPDRSGPPDTTHLARSSCLTVER
jgi:hypothetical protein